MLSSWYPFVSTSHILYSPHIRSREDLSIVYTLLLVLHVLLEQACFRAVISNLEEKEWSRLLRKQIFVVLVVEEGIFLRSCSTGWGIFSVLFLPQIYLFIMTSLFGYVGVCGPCHLEIEVVLAQYV